MEGRAPVSVATGASGDVPLVSPPPMDVESPAPSSSIEELFSAPSTAPVEASQASDSSSLLSTPSGSPATSITLNGQQHVTNTHDQPTTPETASSEKSTSDGVPTPETGVQSTTCTNSNKETAAVEQNNNKKSRKWFEVLPTVLHNFKSHNREQIRQLMLPRCELCERSKVSTKAEVKCIQGGCILAKRSLCSSCWQSTHSSERARSHQRLSSSICPQCQLERISYWCAECDLKFCRECFEQIHSVPRTKHHRKLATEDAPGTCLAKSHWSANFQNVIFQMIAARKHPPPASNGSSGDNVGVKRKRDVEVIVIDDEEEDSEAVINGVQANSSITSISAEQQIGNGGVTVNQQNISSAGAVNAVAQEALTRAGEVFSQLQTPQQAAFAGTFNHVPVDQNSMPEPIPFPQEFTEATSTPLTSPVRTRFETVQTSPPYETPAMSNGANMNSSVGSLQWNNSSLPVGASSSKANGGSSSAFATSGMSNGMMHVSSTSLPTTVNPTSGVWSTTSAISTDLASTSNPNNLLPLGGAVFAENALVDSLVDRYQEVNQNVTNLELQSDQLTRQIAVATCQGPFAATPIMAVLNKLQPVLEAARRRRDKLLIAMIIQSNDIMASVRLLRLTELGDVPQVPMISHRKCLQISNEINQHKKKLIELNQQLSETLNQSNAVNTSWENTLIRTTSANIQMHEKSIKKLKKDREVEIVRIVQFSRVIRTALKHAFQQTVEAQRQHQQQQQQFQQYG